MPRGRVSAILPKNDSIRLSQDPCLGVKVNSRRLGSVPRKARLHRVARAGRFQEFDELRPAMPFAHQAEHFARQQIDTGQPGERSVAVFSMA